MAADDRSDTERRLAELQATLDAIRAGRVDAVLGGDQVLLLRVKELEEERQQFVDFLDLLHRTGAVLLAAADEKALLQEVCDTLAADSLVQACWAVLRRDGTVGIVVEAGWGAAFASFAASLRSDQRPACFEHLTKGPRILHPATDCPACPLRELHGDEDRVAVLPFLCDEGLDGLLIITLAATFQINSDLQKLLERLAGDVGLALSRLVMADRIERSERKFRELAECSLDGYLRLNGQGVIMETNSSFRQMVGYDADELAGLVLDRLVVEEFRQRDADMRRLLDEQDHTPLYEVQYRAKDGASVHVEVRFYRSRAVPPEEGTVWGIVRDIGERKRAAQEKADLTRRLQQAQKLEAIGTMAAGIAHDFNNILTAILGFAELAREDIPVQGTASRDLEQVIHAAERARELVAQILTFCREDEQTKRPVVLQPLVKESLKLLRASIPPTIRLEENMVAPGVRVEADPTKIHQLVMNLCTNAYHAMKKEGGVLSVSLRRVDLDAEAGRHLGLAPGPYLRLRVGDTGCGIEDHLLERIFDPYFTTKEPGEGTGLGLAVVHGIVTDAGGAIDVKSEVGRGSTFDVYLPVMEMEDSGETAEDVLRLPLPLGRERVLVVDDEEPIVDLVTKHLLPLGYRVEGCTSTAAALDLLPRDRFDLVIVDLLMPEMNGLRFIERVHLSQPQLPAILMTGLGGAVAPVGLGERGCAALLVKPFSQRQLATLVRQVLDRYRSE